MGMILATAGLGVASCVRNGEVPEPEPPIPGGVNVQFRMSIPTSGARLTRAADNVEFAVNNLSLLVLVQEGGVGNFTYRYRAVGRKLDQPGGAAVDFEALLVDSPDPVRLLAVANCADGFFDAIEEGWTEARIRSELVSNSSDFSQGIPMTGVAELASITDAMGVVRIPLVRSVAKATVTVLLDGSSPDFTISSVEVWRTPVDWQTFPDVENIENESTAPVPVDPSVPNAGNVINRSLSSVGSTYSGYVYETAIPSGLPDGADPATVASCIIVGGRFADDQADTYYRINFGRLGDQANPLGQVLRNYWYEYTIVGVEASGWESAETAAANPASGLRTTATPWNGGGNTDYYFGYNDYIKLSADSMVLDAQIGHTATMTVTTSGVPFTATSVHDPGAGQLDTAVPQQNFETDKIRFEMASIPADQTGEQKWQLTVTALTEQSITDYLQLHAADGLMTINIFIQRDPPPGAVVPDPNDPTKRKIRVLNLGSVTYGSMNRQTDRGVPAMLRNTSYFGPTGTVVCAGIEFVPMLSTANSQTNVNMVKTALAGADIIVTPYNYQPSSDVSYAIYEWLSVQNSGRAALLSMDEPASNLNLRVLLDGGTRWQNVGYINNTDTSTYFGYGTGYTGVELLQPPASGDDPAAPFLDGVFGNARNCSNPDVTPYDGTSLYVNIAGANSQIVPLIVSYGNAGQNSDVIMVGVDPNLHVVYNGCATLLHTEGMVGGPAANTALAYNSANYLNAMWANTWAWMVNKVMTENYDVPEALIP